MYKEGDVYDGLSVILLHGVFHLGITSEICHRCVLVCTENYLAHTCDIVFSESLGPCNVGTLGSGCGISFHTGLSCFQIPSCCFFCKGGRYGVG